MYAINYAAKLQHGVTSASSSDDYSYSIEHPKYIMTSAVYTLLQYVAPKLQHPVLGRPSSLN